MEEEIQAGNALIRQKRFDEADKLFEDLAKKFPKTQRPLRGLVRVGQAKRNGTDLIRRLDRLLDAFPGSLDMRIKRAHLENKYENPVSARKKIPDLLDATESEGISPKIANNLLRLLCHQDYGSQRVLHLLRLRTQIERDTSKGKKADLSRQILIAEIHLILRDHDSFLAKSQKLKDAWPESSPVRMINQVAEKLSSPQYPDFEARKIFGIGLSRTGTTSLNAALNILGWHSVHWQNPLTRELIDHDDLFLFEAFTDITVSHNFEWLYHTFPNAHFILTERDEDDWAKSIAFHYYRIRNANGPADLASHVQKELMRFKANQITANLYSRHPTWKDAIIAFNSRVEAFFADKPPDRLLRIRITEGEGWDKLTTSPTLVVTVLPPIGTEIIVPLADSATFFGTLRRR